MIKSIITILLFTLSLTLHAQHVSQKITTSDGEYNIRVGAQTGEINIIENASREVVATINPPTICQAASLSGDDTKLYAPSGDKVYVYELESQDLINTVQLSSYLIDQAYLDNIQKERYQLNYDALLASGTKEAKAAKSATSMAKKELATANGDISFAKTVFNQNYQKFSFFHFNKDGSKMIRFHMYTITPMAGTSDKDFKVSLTAVMDAYDTKDFSLLSHEIVQNLSFPVKEMGFTPFGTMPSQDLFIFGNEKVKYYSLSKNEIVKTMPRAEFEAIIIGKAKYNALFAQVLAKSKNEMAAKKTMTKSGPFGVSQGMVSYYKLSDGMYLGDFTNFYGTVLLTDLVNEKVLKEFNKGFYAFPSPDKKYVCLMTYNDKLMQMKATDKNFATDINNPINTNLELYSFEDFKLIKTFESVSNNQTDHKFENGKLIIGRKMNNLDDISYDLVTGEETSF